MSPLSLVIIEVITSKQLLSCYDFKGDTFVEAFIKAIFFRFDIVFYCFLSKRKSFRY